MSDNETTYREWLKDFDYFTATLSSVKIFGRWEAWYKVRNIEYSVWRAHYESGVTLEEAITKEIEKL